MVPNKCIATILLFFLVYRPRSRRRVHFDSYVLLLQSLRDRDADAVRSHVLEVRCPAALRTDEVVAEFMGCVAEGRADIAAELLHRGCHANSVDPAHGITPLHLAAAFNSLPLVKVTKSISFKVRA